MFDQRRPKAAVQEAAEVLYKQLMDKTIRKAAGKRQFYNLGTIEYDIEPLMEAVGWDISELYEDLEDFLGQNKKEIRDRINLMLPKGYYINSPYYSDGTVNIWIGHTSVGKILDV